MKVLVTLDRLDGTKSQVRELDLEQVSGSQLSFMMMEAQVAGITITKSDLLTRIQKENLLGA